MKKILLFLLVSAMLFGLSSVCVSAKDKKTSEKVSPALDVLARQTSMSVSGIVGNDVTFTAEKFARGMNLSEVEYVTVKSLPSAADGKLYIGSTPVAEGQTLSASNIALMTFEANGTGESSTSFDFSVNGSGYAVTCNVFLLKEVNYSPTVAMVPAVSLNLNTYTGKTCEGILSAYDPEGDETVFEIVKYPKNGTLSLMDGNFKYVSFDNYIGKDSFRYVAHDRYGNYSAGADVIINVNSSETAVSFDDLSDGNQYISANRLTESRIMGGMQVGAGYYFYPNETVSRAEFLVTAMKAVGMQDVSAVSTDFYDDADIPESMRGYVALACSKNVIAGFAIAGERCFCPNEPISRAEAAVILSNMIGYAENYTVQTFADSGEIPAWASNAVNSLISLGIIQPENSTVSPIAMLTRGQTAVMLDRAMTLIASN